MQKRSVQPSTLPNITEWLSVVSTLKLSNFQTLLEKWTLFLDNTYIQYVGIQVIPKLCQLTL